MMTQACPGLVDHQLDQCYRTKVSFAQTIRSVAPKIACDDIMAVAIALVSDRDIQLMTREDLLDALRAGQRIPHSPARVERIIDLAECDLRRVMHLVRRWTRLRVDKLSVEKGWAPYFRDHF